MLKEFREMIVSYIREKDFMYLKATLNVYAHLYGNSELDIFAFSSIVYDINKYYPLELATNAIDSFQSDEFLNAINELEAYIEENWNE